MTGEGHPIDLVLAPGTVSHRTYAWQRRGSAPPLVERLSRFARLIRFDKRGTGMSDRVTIVATLEERSDDIRAVMDAADSAAALIFGASEGGSMACMFAATHPERTRSLIVWGCQAAFIRSADDRWVSREEYQVERAGAAIRAINGAIAARICGIAVADEVVTSSTVRDRSAGSGIHFEDRGTHTLKGVDGERQLFAAVD